MSRDENSNSAEKLYQNDAEGCIISSSEAASKCKTEGKSDRHHRSRSRHGREKSSDKDRCKKDRKRSKRKKGRCKDGECRGGKVTSNPFFNFLRDFRKKHCGWSVVQVAVEGAKVWCSMGSKDKDRYREMACKAPRMKRRKSKRGSRRRSKRSGKRCKAKKKPCRQMTCLQRMLNFLKCRRPAKKCKKEKKKKQKKCRK